MRKKNEHRNDEQESDYLHPQGQPKLPPKNKEESENLAQAAESTKLAKELKAKNRQRPLHSED